MQIQSGPDADLHSLEVSFCFTAARAVQVLGLIYSEEKNCKRKNQENFGNHLRLNSGRRGQLFSPGHPLCRAGTTWAYRVPKVSEYRGTGRGWRVREVCLEAARILPFLEASAGPPRTLQTSRRVCSSIASGLRPRTSAALAPNLNSWSRTSPNEEI